MGDFNAGVGVTISVIVIFVFGCLIGHLISNGLWKIDFHNFGAISVNGVIYDCKPRTAK